MAIARPPNDTETSAAGRGAPVDSVPGLESPQAARAEAESIAELAALHKRGQESTNASERLAHRITAFSGSMLYVWLHVVWFSAWIAINTIWDAFDPYPFTFLTMIVSLEAIFLSTFVLISQNRQAYQADQRASVDLGLNIVAEREITKLVDMVADLQQQLGKPGTTDTDPDVREMLRPTAIDRLADGAEAATREGEG
jgi:uncharacterized membrane protein